jgi:hypothetical protein
VQKALLSGVTVFVFLGSVTGVYATQKHANAHSQEAAKPMFQGFVLVKTIRQKSFTQHVYSRQGEALSVTHTALPDSLAGEIFQTDLKTFSEEGSASGAPQIRVVQPNDLAAMSGVFTHLGFLTYPAHGSRVEVIGLSSKNGLVVKVRYTNLESADPRRDAAESVAIFRSILGARGPI